MILVLEYPAMSERYAAAFETCGFTVLAALGDDQAFEIVDEFVIDAAVVCLPPSGRDEAGRLFARLRKREGLPILCIGAREEPGEAGVRYIEAGRDVDALCDELKRMLSASS